MRVFRITLLFCGFALSGFVSSSAQVPDSGKLPSDKSISSAVGPTDRYRLGFQDVIDVQVFNQPKYSIRVPVSPNGTISLFRIEKPIVAVCKTEVELASAIADAYGDKILRNPEVKVSVFEQKSQSVAVIGSVEHPGNFYIGRRIHLLELLALAGGPNKEAGTRLLIARTGSTSNCKESTDTNDTDQVAVVDFKIRDIQEGKTTFWMQPGDVVSVLDADIVYVYGNVNHQGSYKIREPITLTQAIVSAEGLKPAAKKDKVRILRQRPGSLERDELVFDLTQIEKRKVNDPFLEPNDIVAVSEERSKAILLGIANTVKAAAPNVIYRIPLP
ncbi:hypothetical protein BH10ACI2_BH10ACI2_19660 [soil metagenome]